MKMEEDDLRQELWIKALKASRAFDPSKTKVSEENFVYMCLFNFVKDLKRVEYRRHNGSMNHNGKGRGREVFTEDIPVYERDFGASTHGEVYGIVDDRFTLPSTVTQSEERIILLLLVGYTQSEARECLGISGDRMRKHMTTIRTKFADWRPSETPVSAPPSRRVLAA